jgi:hypothetical protein
MSNYQKITDQILAQMQTAGAGWMNPMQGGQAGMPRNAVTGRRYAGINVMILGLTGQAWATYKQWQSVGAQVRKGEEGTAVMFFKPLQVKDRETGEDATIPMMRTFTVFNAGQVDGYEVEGIELPRRSASKALISGCLALAQIYGTTTLAVRSTSPQRTGFKCQNSSHSKPVSTRHKWRTTTRLCSMS